jgi:hypothetical protein
MQGDLFNMITLKDIKEAVRTLKANDMPVRFIRNQREADFATLHDPFCRQWKPNDEYYASEDLADIMKTTR